MGMAAGKENTREEGRFEGQDGISSPTLVDILHRSDGHQIAIRLAGIDAPEAAHFGKPSQPYSAEALAWLKGYILNKRVRAYVYRRDQYDRVVATVFVRKYGIRKDVGREMLKMGLATIYEAKMGAEFGDFESKYRRTEKWAKWWKRGIWRGNPKDFESPRDYKTRTAGANEPK